jgi:hypothetical protein
MSADSAYAGVIISCFVYRSPHSTEREACMPIKIKVTNSDNRRASPVEVKVRRPSWQQFLHY